MFSAETKSVAVPVNKTPETVVTWKHIAEPIEPFLEAVAQRLARQVKEFDASIVPYAEYALTGQGKQLRPTLVALAGKALGNLNDSHITIAVIIEMVHLATLVHDDVMDEAEIRRGRLTLGANWGNEIAVLLGDCLFAQSLRLAASFPTPEICRAVATATNTVCTGEILQTRYRRNFQLGEAEYFKVLGMKTAELFALSCDLGACLADATQEERAILRDYGINLGIAYQIYDDCLDLFGTEAGVGKTLGTDLAKGKLTLPVLRLLQRAKPAERLHLEQMITKWETKHLPVVLEYLFRYETLTESIEMIHNYLDRARESAGKLSNTSGAKCLTGLAQFLANQTDKLELCAKS